MKRICALLALTLIAAVPTPVLANKKTVTDPDDVNGEIDIQAVSHGHGSNRTLVHRVEMFEEWLSSDLEPEESWIALLFDIDRDNFNDNRYLRIDYSEEEGLYADMYYQGISGPGEPIGEVRVSRPDERSVKVRFPKRFIKKRLKVYRWRAITSFEDDGECSSEPDSGDQGGCLDYVPPPKKPGILHDLR